MKLYPRKIQPRHLVMFLNSGPAGQVTTRGRMTKHRESAGMRIVAQGSVDHIDLVKYTYWLLRRRHDPDFEEARTGYEKHRDAQAEVQRRQSANVRELGEIPAVVNARRKNRCRGSLQRFCEEYFPQTFHIKWSPDHLKVIARLESVITKGGLFALAMPRGGGKTSLCEAAALWALLYGYHAFAVIIGPDQPHAIDRIDNLRTELEENDLLLEDFPEVCFPIRRLEGITQRRFTYQGRPIRIELKQQRLILPDVQGSDAAGAIVATAGITGQIRGLNLKRKSDGATLRPTLALIDDPQTDESAHSPSQCAQRLRILKGAILGLAGPGQSIAGIMPCTVVRAGDLADRVLDDDKCPEWQSERMKMVYAWPTRSDLWDEYNRLWRDGAPRGDTSGATKYYRRHRKAMDEGSEVAWKQRMEREELSALQHAMNLRLQRGDHAFFAEYQNEPLPEEELDETQLTADDVAKKINGMRRGEIPISCSHLTAFIDVQQKCLYWSVVAWESNFTGYIIDYGTYPDQRSDYFTLRDVHRTMAKAAPGTGFEGSIYAGLEKCAELVIAKEFRRDDGAMMRIDRCLVDANWGRSTNIVFQFCRQTALAGIMMPSHGRYIGAATRPIDQYQRRPGERFGLNWYMPITQKRRQVRHVVFDTNFWKSFVHARLGVQMGDPGCLSMWGQQIERHRMFAEHITAEYSVRTEGRGRTVDEWKERASGLDNHWLDCLVGCAVAASMMGVALPTHDGAGRRRSNRPKRGRKIWRPNQRT